MLPNRHHPDDAKWLEHQLNLLNVELALIVCKKYSAEYQRVYDETEAAHRKDNAARFAANSKLRLFVDKHRGQW